MSTDPIVVLLDDEQLQLLSMRSQLRGIGTLVEFTHAGEALDFARSNPADAMVVDIRMKGQPMDGLGLLRALRGFDADVSVIIRTVDEAEDIIEGAIEYRAMRRLLKSRAVPGELRRYTLAAIAETGARRRQTRAVAEAAVNREKLVEALGTYDVALTAGSVYRGLLHSIRNDLSSLEALSSLLRNPAESGSSLADLAQRNERVVSRMIRGMDGLLDGPFGELQESGPASVNKTIDALRTHFLGASEWIGIEKNVRLRDLLDDALLDCSPVTLFNGLKHLIEFALARAPANSELVMTATLALPVVVPDARHARARLVVNAGLPSKRYSIVFRLTGEIERSATSEILDIASEKMSASRTGNLAVCNQMLVAAHGALLVFDDKRTPIAIEAILPLQR